MKLVIDVKSAETGKILADWIEELRNGQVECLDMSKHMPEIDGRMVGCVVLCDGWHEEGEHLAEIVHDVWREWEPGTDLTPEQSRDLDQASKKWLKEVEK